MSDESRILVLSVEVERLTQENDRLRAENAALRPLVSELQHKLRQVQRHIDTEPIARIHG
jgi:predicted RNase H-like nuclease (RuvC/YqgF family)